MTMTASGHGLIASEFRTRATEVKLEDILPTTLPTQIPQKSLKQYM